MFKKNTRTQLLACALFVKNLALAGTDVGRMLVHALESVNAYRKRNQNTHHQKEADMYLYLREKLKELGDDEQRFFRTAYMWKFGKDYDCVSDVCQFRLHAVIPKYVGEYVNYLQGQQNGTTTQNNSRNRPTVYLEGNQRPVQGFVGGPVVPKERN